MLTYTIYIYSTVIFLVISSVLAILSKHPVFALLYLVICFLNSSILLLLLDCEFLAFMFLIIYVGAIAILFLFVIMLLDIKFKNLSRNFYNTISISLVFIFICCLLFFLTDHKYYLDIKFINLLNFINWKDLLNCINEIEAYSFVLYNFSVFSFLLTGLILLLVLIGVVFYNSLYLNINLNVQLNFKQIALNSNFFNKL